jgi:amidase
MARYVEDVALALALICGPDGRDPGVVPVSLGDPDAVDPAQLRMAWFADNGVVSPARDIGRVVAETAAALARSGIRSSEYVLPGMQHLVELLTQFRETTSAGVILRLLERHGTDLRSREVEGYLAAMEGVGTGCIDPALLEAIDAARGRALRFFDDYDTILCPVLFAPARPHGASHADSYADWSYSQVFNLLGWPALSVRAGSTADGMPVGVQVIAAPWREDIVLALGSRIEELMGGFEPPPI